MTEKFGILLASTSTSNKGNDNDNSHNNTITYNGDKFQPGFFVERPILEAMLRFWPLATHDLSWENILDYWAGDEPCLVPPRSFVRHAVSSYYTLGGDLSPVMPSESKNMDHMIRPFSLKVEEYSKLKDMKEAVSAQNFHPPQGSIKSFIE
ncbi:hypothetical protein SK128_002789 [Halocaridina rubra]|uniref:Uncharacterized protein n=1 Tax=Halocaridina rubra TaxID=373956 RepID=A0AAN8ZW65_HALRR